VNIDSLRIDTPRLILRPPRLEDFEAYAAFAGDAQAARFIGGAQPRNVAWRSFMTQAGAWHLLGFSLFSVICKSSGEWIGRVGPWMPDGWPGTEIGWGIARAHWKRGYATEAAAAAIDWAFGNLGWTEIIHIIDVDNIASQGVARKLGSRNSGRVRMPPPYDNLAVDIWRQTRAEWLAGEHA
jgi:RimJ/RimL family protein N-acetyltransferase